MSPLTRKLGRDLFRIRGQAIAIGLVIAVGVLLQVMMTGLVVSLDETRRAYYERYRLADVFAPVVRAPERLVADLQKIPGVSAVETRVIGSALLNLPGEPLAVRASATSLPDNREPRLNAVYLTEGRMLEAGHREEVVVLKSFAAARQLKLGSSLDVTLNGFRRSFKIVGFAQSPEFLYITAPGEFVSEDSSFAVVWMSRSTLEAAFDMKGAFNQAVLSLTREANLPLVIAAVDQLLDRFGGLGAFGLRDLPSNRFISEEISGLRTTSVSVPPVFMAVAAFLLYMVISRMVQAEREEIGLMKAFGYTNREVISHYFQMILIVAVGGAIAGCLMGIAAGRSLVDYYLIFFKFPFLIFRLDPYAFVFGFTTSVVAASVGGLLVLRRIFQLTPAVAMRPARPPDFSRTGQFGKRLNQFLDQPSRMVIRRLTRQPFRVAGSVSGVAAGIALSAAMASVLASFDDMMELSFSTVDRSDALVTFINPIEARSAFDIESVPGVIEVEPVRFVPTIFHNGLAQYHGAVSGLIERPRLNRAVDADNQPIFMRRDGIILSSGLASTLNIKAGETLKVDVREGRRPTLEIPVAAVAESLLGAPAYMELSALNRALKEPLRVSGAFLRIDETRADNIYRHLKNMPAVAGISLKDDRRAALQKIIDQGAGAQRFVMAFVAFTITFGVVYNAARVAQAERSRDLASLRVLGFTRAEVGFVFLGELVVIILLALPVGVLAGYALTFAVAAGFSTDIYQITAAFNASSYGTAIAIVVASATVSGWLVLRDIDRADLVITLKTME
ncbi:MAG: ABC transporter permease [Rhodobacteraceae bacterium]|nr:ABC transporter permease [Paracoccaceae bacterium]